MQDHTTRTSPREHACRVALQATSSHTEGADLEPMPSGYFGDLTLSWEAIASKLDKNALPAFEAFVHGGTPLTKPVADRVAEVVKDWGVEKGATHYAHWFHPLTGIPSDKQDAFLTVKGSVEGRQTAIDRLAGALLIQGEPDASSFPSGGLRATHVARGYTVWDPHSPIFLRIDGSSRTLCVPCAYASWTGHALDTKTPLLRALDVLSREVTAFVNTVSGTSSVSSVHATLGTEQEYFVVDKAFLAARPDLVMAGRTLVGLAPSRGQQLEDHYFGPIPSRVQAFISEVERDLYQLGVPVKTRHCEVAPAQFELAPVFEEANVACDHNVLTMDVLRRTADKHGLVCLLHEKPFAGINGSGKHNNWSLSTSDGENLLDPGDHPSDNLRFLAMLAVVLDAVHAHGDLLRVSVASAGNDHRLGANEAPPAIISVYLGEALDQIVRSVAEPGDKKPASGSRENLVLTKRVQAKPDLTDRNRTTPFAFTGNKFEFRAVGSSENPAWPMAILNTAVASSCRELRQRLEQRLAKGGDRATAVMDVIRESFAKTSAIRFEGNNYAQEWAEEAAKRGLPILKDTPAALGALHDPARTAFLTEMGVFTGDEIASRYEVYAERYIKLVDIEAATLVEIAVTHVLPVLETQLTSSFATQRALVEAGLLHDRQARRTRLLSELIQTLQVDAERLASARHSLHEQASPKAAMAMASDTVIPAMSALRDIVDTAEAQVADALWPLPKYREMVFAGV